MSDADSSVHAFAEGQPLLYVGEPAVVERVERGRTDPVRLRVKTRDRGVHWCDPHELAPLEGWTPAHTAALRDDPVALARVPVAMLHERVVYPADFGFVTTREARTMNFDGMTPVRVAASVGRLEAVGALFDRGCTLDDLSLYQLGRRDDACTTFLVARGEGARLLSFADSAHGPAAIFVAALRAGFGLDEPLEGGATLRAKLIDPAFRVWFSERALEAMEKAARPGPLHVLRPCPSSSTRCAACRKKIAARSPQFGLGEARPDGTPAHTWFHLACARRAHPHEVATAGGTEE